MYMYKYAVEVLLLYIHHNVLEVTDLIAYYADLYYAALLGLV